MLKFYAFATALFFSLKSFANPACALCTVAIGASLGIARKMGVDDCVVGVWAGAMLAILGYWTIRFFDARGWVFPGYKLFIMAITVGMVGFMYMTDLQYTPTVIFGIFYMDSFLFASIIGALAFIFGMNFYQWMKEKNGGHAHFPFEKVVVPVGIVLLVSLAFNYFPICNCKEPVQTAPELFDLSK